MLFVRYRKLVPYSVPVVLSQYYDYEHIEHVHPESLGRYELVEKSDERLVYRHVWPETWLTKFGVKWRATSLVEHTFHPPNETRFRFLEGRNRGVLVKTFLEEHAEGCVVDETYGIPNLPNWRWLQRLALPSIRKRVDHIWDEDIDVDVCHGGWPGVPEVASRELGEAHPDSRVQSAGESGWVDVAAADSLAMDRPLAVDLETEGETAHLVLIKTSAGIRAVGATCPHSGGPLALGNCLHGEIVCPWHGARFSLASGEAVAGPTEESIPTYLVRERQERIEVQLQVSGGLSLTGDDS